MKSTIINFANNILINNEKPAQLGETDMIPIPKTGDLDCQVTIVECHYHLLLPR